MKKFKLKHLPANRQNFLVKLVFPPLGKKVLPEKNQKTQTKIS